MGVERECRRGCEVAVGMEYWRDMYTIDEMVQ